MQSGIDTSRAALAEATTRITIQPDGRGKHAFFGADGIGIRDLIDAINPLEHIPFISNLFNEATDHTPSTASRLAGGALLGGPIGFVASLAGVIFEQETGKGIGETMIAALTGAEDEAPTQLAQLPEGQEILPPEPPKQQAAQRTPEVPMVLASVAAERSGGSIPPRATTILDLYGGSAASAHRSYQAAQLRPYLRDVTHSQIL